MNTARTQPSKPDPPDSTNPAAKAAAAWVGLFARTLKTCRLYDANNPTVIKFRDEAAGALRRALDETGSWRLRFVADDVLLEDSSLYPARSRDDNLALPFFRDGVRALTVHPGIEPDEVNALVDAVLQVTGQNVDNDDLVTLLWEANLRHVDVDYVPPEDDVGGGGSGEAPEAGERSAIPWPGSIQSVEEEKTEPEVSAEESINEEGRSDDWSMGVQVIELEAQFDELATLAPGTLERFREEFRLEHEAPLLPTALMVSRAYLAAGANAEDRVELARFQPRLLRLAISRGAWDEARQALEMLGESGGSEWSIESFVQELLQPISIASAIEHVDRQEAPQVQQFIELARDFGDLGIDWLNLVLAETQQGRNRRMIAEAIAVMCRDHTERLAPWLSDPRWYVVRNVVHILGWIGGPSVVSMLQVAARHPDPRVRVEVVAALGQCDAEQTRPVLMGMLEGADARMFCSILHQLGGRRDPQTGKLMVLLLQDPQFEQRTAEEQRAILSTLGSAGGDEIVADLEAELLKGSWFARYDSHRGHVARTLARIGTPLAHEVLSRHVNSKRIAVRKACEDALRSFSQHE
jgi:HEAT repeat protein